MADATKYQLVPNGNNNNNNSIIPDMLKSPFSVFSSRKRTKSSVFVHGVVLIFVLFTIFVAFMPSTSYNSPWFINIFAVNSTSPSQTYSEESYRSHFSSIFSYFFPNATESSDIYPSGSLNITNSQLPSLENATKSELPPDKGKSSEQKQRNQSVVTPQISQLNTSGSQNSSVSQVPSSSLNQTQGPDEKDQLLKQETCKDGTCSEEKQRNQSVVSEANPSGSQNVSMNQVDDSSSSAPTSVNSTGSQVSEVKDENLMQKSCQNETCSGEEQSKQSTVTPQTSQLSGNSSSMVGNGNGDEEKEAKGKVDSTDIAASLSKMKPANETGSGEGKKQGNGESDLVSSLVHCDLYDGNWVRDESYPLYKPGSCSFIDEQFSCLLNGRPDKDYQKLKWKPKGCTLPRLEGRSMLELLRGKRLVFVGDSLNRNMWESLVCILKNSAKNPKKVYEASGKRSFRNEAHYSFVFKDYDCTVEFFVAPFLVLQWETKDNNGGTKETLRIDLMAKESDEFKNADFLIFNTGHWWTHEKTSKGEDYYQEGSNVYKQLDVNEAFRRAMTTWARWIDANVNPQKTHIFFRGYSASHFSGGQWNSGGQCDSETEPIRNDTYLTPYPTKMKVFEKVIKNMKNPVSYINVTKLTDYRKDGHPSIYRRLHVPEAEKREPLKYQDCSHWCLPGVPDSWNELLYAEILRKQYKDQQQKNKT